MDSKLKKYLSLISEHRNLFKNRGKGTIEIITDSEIIQIEEIKIKQKYKKENLPESFGDIGIIGEDPYFLVIRDLVEFPNGRKSGYLRIIERASLDSGQAVVILPVYVNKIILVRNFRHGTRNWELEIPRGFGENGVSPENNAKKELKEETGLNTSKLTLIGKLNCDTSMRTSNVMMYHARIEELSESTINDEETISGTILLEKKDFENKVIKGEIIDGFTISAYSMAKIRGLI